MCTYLISVHVLEEVTFEGLGPIFVKFKMR